MLGLTAATDEEATPEERETIFRHNEKRTLVDAAQYELDMPSWTNWVSSYG